MDSTQEIFSYVQEYCQKMMPAGPYKLWIKDILCDSFDETSAVLLVPTNFRRQIIESKYLEFLTTAFQEVVGFPVRVSVQSEEERRSAEPPPESRQQEFIETIKTMARMTLQDDYR